MQPKDTQDYIRYFCGDTTKPDDLTEREYLRVTLYKSVSKLLRDYADRGIANEMTDAGYTPKNAAYIQQEVAHFGKMRDEVKLACGDYVDMKRYEPAMAETIENNMRKTIVDENPVNPKYYEQMSALLEALIEERHQQAISYQEYLKKIKALADKVVNTNHAASDLPDSIDTVAKKALYDNLNNNELLANKLDMAIRYTKKADWVGDRMKEKEIARTIYEELAGYDVSVETVLEIAKRQKEYQSKK